MIVEGEGQYKDHDSPTMWHGELEIYKPTIAAVNGYAFGEGCSLVLSCDLRIASETATFGHPQPKYGAMNLGGGDTSICPKPYLLASPWNSC